MQHTYKILSLLLDYPSAELHKALPETRSIVQHDNYLNHEQCDAFQSFLDQVQPLSLSDWQMQYVQLFDFASNGNLYLFDHVYGDSRERGQAMVDLTEMYVQSGFEHNRAELPDYLPLFLEYLSLLNDRHEVEKLLKEIAHILENMKNALSKKETAYALLLEILCTLASSSTLKIEK
ncbi:MAG: nitrate reductase molybdenum cofactor assembly chaperone [Mangrovibacterium sp.]